MQQIQITKTLDVELVERELAELWQQTTGALDPTDTAVLRARVANLLVFVSSEQSLDDVQEVVRELTAVHPSRVAIMVGDRAASDQDIEMFVGTLCQTDKRTGTKRLTCEEVTLKARGKFSEELPSAALPLLVSDLSTFLWWRGAVEATDKILRTLLQSVDRLIIDSSEFEDPPTEVIQANRLFARDEFRQVGVSDINWARLTLWRGLLADFYDVPAYLSWLDQVDYVSIDFVATENKQNAVAPQALLMAGWLASRLNWILVQKIPAETSDATNAFEFETEGRTIRLALNRVERPEFRPGRLVQVETRCTDAQENVSFKVVRSEDGKHILAEAFLGATAHRGRVMPVRNRSESQLLSREMEILCNDIVYEEALAMAAKMLTVNASQAPPAR